MLVKIGSTLKDIIIPEAKVERFIDLQSGTPKSAVKISYMGKSFEELSESFVEEEILSFDCEILKTKVVIDGLSIKESLVEYVFHEKSSEVPCYYKAINKEHKFGNERAILIPTDVRDIPSTQISLLRELPFIRLILREDIPKGYLLPFPRY
ncbi:MAG: hypothetical protein FK732_07255 [Asgard group archaeon]|nr:hypothetical protein [Asgard group archaeon]